MAYFTWSDELSVGNGFIDSDHRKLIDLVNKLHEAMAQGKGKDILGQTLGSLIKYTQEHFKREEDEMQRIGYAASMSHRREHDKLVRSVLELQKQFDEGNVLLTLPVSKFLKEWLVDHIMKTDKLLAAAIKAAATLRPQPRTAAGTPAPLFRN